MFMRIHKDIQIAWAVAAATFKEWSVYRTHTLVSVFVGPVFFAVQYFIWTAVYGSRPELAGLELEQIIRYFGATALIGYLTMDFADWNLSMLIRTGRFITFSLRPVHHRFFALAQKLGHRVLGFSLEFIPCIIIFHFVFGVDMRPAHIPWTILSVALAFLINFYFHYILGLTSFWFVEAGGLRRVIQLLSMFFSGALIPLAFFPEGLRMAQYFLPFQYTVYVPAMVFIGNFQPYMILYQGFAVLIMYALSEWIYRRAMRHYNDVGA
jgi:ABC-2 type transport system permease protein